MVGGGGDVGDGDEGRDRGGDEDVAGGQRGDVGRRYQHDDGGRGDGQQQQHGGDGRRCGGGGLGSATIDVSEIISPLTNFLLSIGVTRGIITLLKSNVVINTFDLHVLSKKPAHEGQKSSSPHTISLSRCLFITLLMIHNTFFTI